MSRVVLDTNALASGFVGVRRAESTPGELVRRWRRGAFELVIGEPVIAEFLRTLGKPYFAARMRPDAVERAVRLLRHRATTVPVTARVEGVATHPDDDLVLATAVGAGANYLVTADKQLLVLGGYGEVVIVSPRTFLDVLEAARQPSI